MILKKYNIIRGYNAGFLKDHYPKWIWQELLHTQDPNHGVTKQNDCWVQV